MPILQYRQKVDVTVRAGMWTADEIAKSARYEWSDWETVPTEHQQPIYRIVPTEYDELGI